MRAFGYACLASVALALPGLSAAAPPSRVASLNLCTDELLLMIAAPAQIVSITHLARQPEETPLWRAARAHARNDGSLLSVAPLRPDLVLTMGGGARDRMRIAGRLGIRTLDLPFPQSLDDIDRAILKVGRAVGRQAAAHALAGQLRALRRTAPTTGRDSIWLGGGGRSLAPTGLGAAWMRLAGLRQRALPGHRAHLEQLVASPPGFLLRSRYRSHQQSRERDWLRHPLARQVRSRSLWTDGRRWTCMGPTLMPEILRLRRQVTS